MGLRDRFKNFKESVSEWTDNMNSNSLDRKIEKNLVEMESGTEVERTAAIKALVIQAQTDEKWLEPIVNSFVRVLPSQLASPQESIIDGLMDLKQKLPSREKKILSAIQEALDSPYPQVRSKVVDIWTEFSLEPDTKTEGTVADLFEMLSDDDRDVRYKTQESLTKIIHTIPKLALPNLKNALNNDDWHQASGSFWAARSYGQLNEYKEIYDEYKEVIENVDETSDLNNYDITIDIIVEQRSLDC